MQQKQLKNITENDSLIFLNRTSVKDCIRLSTIVHCQKDGKNCIFYLNNGNKHIIHQSFYSILQQLPEEYFIRLHPSHIVNIVFINRYVGGKDPCAILFDGTKVPVTLKLKGVDEMTRNHKTNLSK